MVTVPTKDVGEVKSTITIINNNLGDIKDKFIGNNNYGLEESNINYIKQEMKLRMIINVKDVNYIFVLKMKFLIAHHVNVNL